MAKLTSAQKAQLKCIRGNQFAMNRKKGIKPRHPDKAVTILNTTDNSCTRLRSDYSKRPEKADKDMRFTTVPPVRNADNVMFNSKKTDDAVTFDASLDLQRKVEKLGLTMEQWKQYIADRKVNPELTLSIFKDSL